MSRLSTGERKRLVDIMKCEREEGFTALKDDLEQERLDLTAGDQSLIDTIDFDINDLKHERQVIQENMDKMVSDAKLDNIHGRACGDTHKLIKEYRKETNQLEKDILLSDSK